MTKEQVEKFGEVIKWYCDNPDRGVMVRHINSTEWKHIKEPSFSSNNIYVQNDVYVELRMARADGKIIQYYKDIIYQDSYEEHKWTDITNTNFSFYSVHEKYLRIKPDEPKFKIGNWVIDDEDKVGQIQTMNEAVILTTSSIYDKPHRVFELWQPKEGEWCVFWNKDSEYEKYIIAKYRNLPHDNNYTADYSGGCTSTFSNIAPLEFIQTLKNR